MNLGSRRVAGTLVCLLAAACSSPTAPQQSVAADPAVVSVSSFTAVVSVTSTGAVYHTSLTLRETGGRSGATISALSYTGQRDVSPLTALYTPATTQRIAAGGSLDLGSFDITDSASAAAPPAPAASQIAVTVGFTDDGGHRGTATATASVAPPPPPPPPPTFALSGLVTDGTSGGVLPNILIQIVDGPNAGWSVFTDAGGRYTLTGISAGSFTLSASAVSYETTIRPVAVSGNAHVDIVLPRAVSHVLGFEGNWDGTAVDSQGAMFVSWALTQTGNAVSGTVNTRAVHPLDGSCSSCHRSKSGTVSGTISGTTMTLTMFFAAGGGGDPTPACSATLSGTAESFAEDTLIAAYTGGDTCEGPFNGGMLPMARHP